MMSSIDKLIKNKMAICAKNKIMTIFWLYDNYDQIWQFMTINNLSHLGLIKLDMKEQDNYY